MPEPFTIEINDNEVKSTGIEIPDDIDLLKLLEYLKKYGRYPPPEEDEDNA